MPLDNPVAQALAALPDSTTQVGLEGATRMLATKTKPGGGGIVQAIYDVAGAEQAEMVDLNTKAVTANTVALQSLVSVVADLRAAVLAGNAIDQASLTLAQNAAAASDLGYAKNLAANAAQMIVKAGANGAQLTTIAASCGATLGVLGAGAGTATFFYADLQTATSGTVIAAIPFAGNNSNSAFLKVTIPAGKYLMVVSNVGNVTATCTVRQL